MTAHATSVGADRIQTVFRDPSLAGMIGLDWSEFEDFVQLVFLQAGYHVTKVARQLRRNYVDLELRLEPTSAVIAHVEVRRYSTANIIRARVLQFLGALEVKHMPRGYIVTTSDFTQPARQVAVDSSGRVHLVNGQQFLRYIEYVRGSRLTDEQGVPVLLTGEPISPEVILAADAIPRLDPQRTTVVALANNKGGVAKTTSTVELGLVLSERLHQRVLVIDMDPQANLTTLLPPPAPPRPRGRRGGAAPSAPPPAPASLPDYVLGRKRLVNLVRDTTHSGVWIIPADGRLVSLDLAGATRPELLAFVRDLHDGTVVAPDGQPFDWILLDTAPAQSFYTRAAIAASHYVVLPACAETLAVQGANIAVKTTRTMRALTGKGAALLGCVVTRWKSAAPANKALIELTDLIKNEQIRLGGSSTDRPRVYASYIPVDTGVERGHLALRGGRLSQLLHLSQGGAGAAYAAFARELMKDANRS